MSDIEIARKADKKPIQEIGAKLGIPTEHLLPYGHDKAKVSEDFIKGLKDRPNGKLILVTAINPTPAGEGKTTTTVGLGDGLNAIGKKAAICIREASLGPNFGMKGGAAGGGMAQVVPMEDMNLHFTGDFHAITSAHNLLAAMLDNHIYWGNELDIDIRRIPYRRVMDMNDRALRQITCSLGGVANGFPREAGFDITVASEVMAILCLAKDLSDLRKAARRHDRRLSPRPQPDLLPRHQGRRRDDGAAQGRDAAEPGADAGEQPGLRAWRPLRQHRPWLQLGHRHHDGAEARRLRGDRGRLRRRSGRREVLRHQVPQGRPQARGGGDRRHRARDEDERRRQEGRPGTENVEAVKKGCANLGQHIENVKSFGVPAVVAINHFVTDTDAEVQAIKDYVRRARASEAILCKHWAKGSEGIEDLARKVVELAEGGTADFAPIYPDAMPLFEKIETIANGIYRADEVMADKKIRDQLKHWEEQGYGNLPVCMAKTQYSFTTDPNRRGAPRGHSLPVREVRLSAGAGFVVVICGEIMTMPGLPRVPSAENIRINEDGLIDGLF